MSIRRQTDRQTGRQTEIDRQTASHKDNCENRLRRANEPDAVMLPDAVRVVVVTPPFALRAPVDSSGEVRGNR